MAKQILQGKPLRDKLLSGVEQLATAVTSTLGPKGRNVGIEKTWIEPSVVHDGVSVAKEIELEDPFENMGAQLVRQAAGKTADKAGDGTTTSTLLAYEMIKRGFKAIDEGANPMTMKIGMENTLQKILEYINSQSKPIQTQEELAQIATISSADPEIGKVIGEAMYKVGKDGVISSDVYAGLDIKVEYKEGMEFDKGYISGQFVTNIEKQESEINNPFIVITDHTITSSQEIAAFLELFVKGTESKDIVFICNLLDGAALPTILINKDRGNINPLAVFAPGFAERKKDILEDIATITGGKVIYKDKTPIDKILSTDENGNVVGLENLGMAESVWADSDTTRIVGGYGKPEAIEERAKGIKTAITKTDSDFEKEKLRERLARLTAGAAIIQVGARTEVELSDKKERVIDAVEATKAASAEGIVAGGGVTLDETSSILDGNDESDEGIGIRIIKEALQEPYKKLLRNAGIDETKINAKSVNGVTGINVMTGEVGDMFQMGIIDPARVTKEAVANAVSVASMILTMDTGIVKIPDKVDKEKIS